MDEEKDKHSLAPPSVQKILLLLKGLRKHPAGALIYQQVERMLLDTAAETLETEHAYAALLGILLDAVAEQVPEHEPLRLQIRLVQRRLSPPLLDSELRSLRRYTERWIDRLRELSGTEDEIFRQALGPLMHDLGLTTEEKAFAETPEQAPQGPEPRQPQAEQRVDLAYRHHLDETNREIQRLQSVLARQIQDTISQNQVFRASMEAALTTLKGLEEAGDVARTKGLVIQEVEKFLAGQSGVTDKLSGTHETLQQVADSSHRIGDELNRVRQLSLTDELTGLSNRRAFQRRLEDELARANRYGHPLTLAMIDLDEFKEINDKYGHAAGDRVLTAYAKKILSTFRHHDMVARYGGEEFAVLLPNTELTGSLRALDKVRERIPNIDIQLDDATIKPPTLSAGVAVFHPGETAQACISRADTALYHAKLMGRDRVEVAKEDRPSGEGHAGSGENHLRTGP